MRTFEEIAAWLREGGVVESASNVFKAWGLVSLGDWLLDHPAAFWVDGAVIVAGLGVAVSKKS
jgi:hypothetical protein